MHTNGCPMRSITHTHTHTLQRDPYFEHKLRINSLNPFTMDALFKYKQRCVCVCVFVGGAKCLAFAIAIASISALMLFYTPRDQFHCGIRITSKCDARAHRFVIYSSSIGPQRARTGHTVGICPHGEICRLISFRV